MTLLKKYSCPAICTNVQTTRICSFGMSNRSIRFFVLRYEQSSCSEFCLNLEIVFDKNLYFLRGFTFLRADYTHHLFVVRRKLKINNTYCIRTLADWQVHDFEDREAQTVMVQLVPAGEILESCLLSAKFAFCAAKFLNVWRVIFAFDIRGSAHRLSKTSKKWLL